MFPRPDGIVLGGTFELDQWDTTPEPERPPAFAGLEADGTFSTTIRTYSYGAHACHVAVDARTGLEPRGQS